VVDGTSLDNLQDWDADAWRGGLPQYYGANLRTWYIRDHSATGPDDGRRNQQALGEGDTAKNLPPTNSQREAGRVDELMGMKG
jgi:hypothetical protein